MISSRKEEMSNALMRGVKADEDEEERCAEPDVLL